MNDLLSVFWDQILQTSWLESIAVIFGLLSVWFSNQENILVFPTGLISVGIYVYITYQYKLYADAGINAYYFVMSIYGWYHWLEVKDNGAQIPITKNTRFENLLVLGLWAASFILLRYVLINFTDSDIPNVDALTTAFALVAMWLMARKKIEHWVAWIIADLISIPLYIYKGLPFTSFQFLVFTILAVWGYLNWRNTLRNAQ